MVVLRLRCFWANQYTVAVLVWYKHSPSDMALMGCVCVRAGVSSFIRNCKASHAIMISLFKVHPWCLTDLAFRVMCFFQNLPPPSHTAGLIPL